MVHRAGAEDQPVPQRAVDEVARQRRLAGLDLAAGYGAVQQLAEGGAPPGQEPVPDLQRLALVGGGRRRPVPQHAYRRGISRIRRRAQELRQVPQQRPGVGDRDGPLAVFGHGVQEHLRLGGPPAVERLLAHACPLRDRLHVQARRPPGGGQFHGRGQDCLPRPHAARPAGPPGQPWRLLRVSRHSAYITERSVRLYWIPYGTFGNMTRARARGEAEAEDEHGRTARGRDRR